MAFVIKLLIFLIVLVCSVHCYVRSDESSSSEEFNDKYNYSVKPERPRLTRISGNFESGNLVYGNFKSETEKMEIDHFNSGEDVKHKQGLLNCPAPVNNMILKKSNETKIRVIETPENYEDADEKSPVRPVRPSTQWRRAETYPQRRQPIPIYGDDGGAPAQSTYLPPTKPFQLDREEQKTAEVHLEPQTEKPEHTPQQHSSEDLVSPMQNYTFAVSIQKKHSHYANGVLVAPTWVLTTAEEFFTVRESIKLYRARLGSVDCKHGGLLVAIQSIQIHPKFKRGEPNYDLALLKLPYPVEKTKYVKPIAISKVTGHITSAKFLTTYWPRLIIKGKVLADKAKERLKSHNLRVSTQKLIAHPQCKEKMTQLNVSLSSSTLCLKPIATHHSSCLPDAGSPIIANDELWGITSGWTWENCTQKPQLTPTLFTRLRMKSVMSWLNNFIIKK